MSVFHSLPPTYILFIPSISVGKPVCRLFRCLLSKNQSSLISLLPSAAPFDTQGIPRLMHCKFSSIMNCMRRIKGMDVEHTLQRDVRGSESTNEPKLAITRGLRMSYVQAMGHGAHTNRSMQTSAQSCTILCYMVQREKKNTVQSDSIRTCFSLFWTYSSTFIGFEMKQWIKWS